MFDWLSRIFAGDFMPHGHCYYWTPAMVWLQAGSNLLIGAAYMSISITLWYLVRRVRDVPFQMMYVAFGVFIVTCGFTHFLDVWTIWTPVYWLDGGVRAVTAVASVGTAVLLYPLIPKAVSLGDAARLAHDRGIQLEALNHELAALYARTRESLAEAIPQLVWTSTPDGKVEYRNQRWIEYAGEPAGGADWSWLDALHPDDAGAHTERWQRALAAGEAFEVECRVRRHDGLYRWHLARALPVREDAGRIVRWFATATDIDDSKRIAEERESLLARTREALRAREVFLTVAAHELRTPLTPLRLQLEGLCRRAQAEGAGAPAPDKLAVALRQVDRLEDLVNQLLDVSRIAAGRLELRHEEVDLAQVVREVADRHAPEAERAGAQLEVHVTPTTGFWDRLRVEQVVTNVLVNAIKFSEGKPVTIELRGDDRTATLVVRDRGDGIPHADQERIFQQFERASSARHYAGLGLGLWIAHQIVQALGGRITVESEPGAGSAFTVELPRRRGAVT